AFLCALRRLTVLPRPLRAAVPTTRSSAAHAAAPPPVRPPTLPRIWPARLHKPPFESAIAFATPPTAGARSPAPAGAPPVGLPTGPAVWRLRGIASAPVPPARRLGVSPVGLPIAADA